MYSEYAEECSEVDGSVVCELNQGRRGTCLAEVMALGEYLKERLGKETSGTHK